MAARALALLDRAEEARAAYDRILTETPAWRPAPEADPRVVAAVEAARRAQLLARLPTTLEPRPWPIPETPDLLGPLVMFRPAPAADGADTEPGPWSVSLGGGIAIPLPDSDHLYAPGPAALLEGTS
jgi:hypothetical protein